ncbi:non-hydrolyzing UDP-N-acetylglucosamine 2-epimerase [Pseudobacteriovorax antillogorgiicola]|uniref:UDP-N-acetylglucosamine 2-epimerase (Non-hydrolysing) n=1 Tax=Pseudobacteriovorax antillogorgiicola TaxID=1513793 RepID=A0A1Y6C373_9BACT|nr:UDP-N-acetylglucosamine 2-epimerase (non-hydrolyzing) [Pseudobacteriovorax antillogorgiicola]TCS50627.1 UDP-N-acetylglucosamine 2-epimerase (non-hydrolysing) [Pseudobacteriovorax antillogorgiicola]SMF39433.1 UDP-N-acetylglucosamine 2-epimerase (non-hydrolysing) [Pseudobacteriovorax antillogorgiicola]
MSVAIVVGTRPEIIKVAPLVWELEKRNLDFFIVHSNQHYSPEMDAVFFEDLNLPAPKYNLHVGSGSHGNQTGNILIKIEPIFEKEMPKAVLVQGDTNTVLAAGMAASKLGILVGHVEAGLRSYDRTMPEETNRVIVDHLSDFLFAVTDKQHQILLSEGVEKEKIHTVGNTVIDTLYQMREYAELPLDLQLAKDEYVLLTAHRASNVDSEASLMSFMEAINSIASRFEMPVLFPIHPRTAKMVENSPHSFHKNIRVIPPQSYKAFSAILANARLVVTDSGGLQEEACALQVPCVTIRENTERPETIEVGANILAGIDPEKVIDACELMLNRARDWSCPFGDGTTARKIIDILQKNIPELHSKSKDKHAVTVVGLGYMGLPMALLLAEAGHDVSGFDISKKKIDMLVDGNLPFDEPGLPELFAKARNSIEFSTNLRKSDSYLISVPTPIKDRKCDLSYVERAFEAVLEVCDTGDLVVVESTIRPGTCRDVLQPLADKKNKQVLIAHCPERAIPGSTIHELKHNARLVGGLCADSTKAAVNLYSSFVEGEVVPCEATTAELAKVAENTFRDINIAFANQLDAITEDLGVSSLDVIKLANLHPRVSILQPGIGVGGHCIAIDPWFLIEQQEEGSLIEEARVVNDARPGVIAQRLAKVCNENGYKRVGILGVAYKPNVDDTRETPVLHIADELERLGLEVVCHDPLAVNFDRELVDFQAIEDFADLIFVAVEHDVFSDYRISKPLVNKLGKPLIQFSSYHSLPETLKKSLRA